MSGGLGMPIQGGGLSKKMRESHQWARFLLILCRRLF
jgi:hypothetical protein